MQRALDNNENDKSFIHNSYPNTIIMIFRNHKEITAVISIVPIILTFHFIPMSPFFSLPPSVSLILPCVSMFIIFHYFSSLFNLVVFNSFAFPLLLYFLPASSSFCVNSAFEFLTSSLCFSFRPPFLI